MAPFWWSSAVATDPLAVTFIDFILLGNQAKNAAAAVAATAPQLRLALESHFFFLFGLTVQWQGIAVAYSKQALAWRKLGQRIVKIKLAC